MSDLRGNKILGAALATGLVILGLMTASDVLFHVEAPEKPGYAIAIQEEAAEGPAAEVPPDWGTVLPVADLAAGETVFGKCVSCHNITPGGAAMTGPALHGVVGRKPAGAPGFAFSPAMAEHGNAVGTWGYQALYDFIRAPQQVVKGTKMTFVGVKDQEDLVNLIAYMRSQSPGAPPIPAPNPAAAAPAEGAESSGTGTGTGAGPTAAPEGAPANSATANPTGQTPTTGAAAAPTQEIQGGATDR